MNKEKDFIILSSFVAIGVIVLGIVVSFINTMLILPIAILGVILFILLLLQVYPKVNHITENIEKIVFFITLLFIISSLIFLYKPV
ncbi:MAG: hypothetical protein LBM96_09340 [Methanobrevibacter sp.]|jgi:energy-converting hydrogenase A subunit K|nr:hypothetical protein [Candidatus Methanoflexus mossambicus]